MRYLNKFLYWALNYLMLLHQFKLTINWARNYCLQFNLALLSFNSVKVALKILHVRLWAFPSNFSPMGTVHNFLSPLLFVTMLSVMHENYDYFYYSLVTTFIVVQSSTFLRPFCSNSRSIHY